jgi:tetratricopeptide (TPR) repeat protein
MSDLNIAIGHLRKALDVATHIKNRREEGRILNYLGLALLLPSGRRRPEKALEFFIQAADIATQIEDIKLKADALGNLGITHYYLGQLNESMKCHQSALLLHRRIGDKRGENADLENIALTQSAFEGQHSSGEENLSEDERIWGLAVRRITERLGRTDAETLFLVAESYFEYESTIQKKATITVNTAKELFGERLANEVLAIFRTLAVQV